MVLKDNNDELMKAAANLIQNEIDLDNLEHENRDIHIPADFDEKMLWVARKKDAERRSSARKRQLNKWFRVAAVVLICAISVGSMGILTSEAFRKNIIKVFPNEMSESVTLYNADEERMIGTWTEYWYPDVLPEGFVLTAAEEADHFLYYENAEEGLQMCIFEQSLDSSVTFDTAKTQMEKFEINYNEVYLFKAEDSNLQCATWQNDDHIMMISFDGQWEKTDIMEVIKGLKYIES